MTENWTYTAKIELNRIAVYLKTEFGIRTVIRFNKDLKKVLDILNSNPSAFSIESSLTGLSKEYRSVMIDNYNKLIYYFENQDLFILDFWDTRRDPNYNTRNFKCEN